VAATAAGARKGKATAKEEEEEDEVATRADPSSLSLSSFCHFFSLFFEINFRCYRNEKKGGGHGKKRHEFSFYFVFFLSFLLFFTFAFLYFSISPSLSFPKK